jgi:hypothetical protein
MCDQRGQQNRSRQQIQNARERRRKTGPYPEGIEENVRRAVEPDPHECGERQACQKWGSRGTNLAFGEAIVKSGAHRRFMK